MHRQAGSSTPQFEHLISTFSPQWWQSSPGRTNFTWSIFGTMRFALFSSDSLMSGNRNANAPSVFMSDAETEPSASLDAKLGMASRIMSTSAVPIRRSFSLGSSFAQRLAISPMRDTRSPKATPLPVDVGLRRALLAEFEHWMEQ